MKLLSLNAGYFLGFDGTLRDYVRHPLRTVIGSSVESSLSAEKFNMLVDDVDPEAVLLQEIDQGSIRSSSTSVPSSLENQLSEEFRAHPHTKYGGLVGNLPFTSKMSNSILTKNGNVENHFLDNGTKNLVQELSLNGVSIFSVHLSRFGGRVRKNQIKEIAEITERRDSYIVAGDFNFMKDSEITHAEDALGQKISPGKTFPAKNPSKALDMAFKSGNISVEAKSLDKSISDHRPIVIEIN